MKQKILGNSYLLATLLLSSIFLIFGILYLVFPEYFTRVRNRYLKFKERKITKSETRLLGIGLIILSIGISFLLLFID